MAVMYEVMVNAGLQEVLLGDLLALVEKELHVIGVLMVASSLLQFLGMMVWLVLVHLSSMIISLPFLTATCLFSEHSKFAVCLYSCK